MLQVSDSMGGFEALFETRKWKHNSLEAFMSCRLRRNVINFHSISRIKSCSFEGFMRELSVFWAAPLLHFTPGTLICSVIKSPEAFAIHIPCIKTQSRPQVWALRFELIKSPRGLGELDRSALLHPLKWHYRNICFSHIFVPARRQPEMRAEPE